MIEKKHRANQSPMKDAKRFLKSEQKPPIVGSVRPYKSSKRAINERVNESRLMESNLSNDLKVSTYEL